MGKNNYRKDIAKMHTKFGVNKVVKKMDPEMLKRFLAFRVDFLYEEFDETKKALEENNAEEFVDGLIDLIVVSLGTLDAMEVNATTAWNSVHKANMSKEAGVNESRPNELGLPDLVKPSFWQAPSHEGNHGLLVKAFEKELNKYNQERGKPVPDFF